MTLKLTEMSISRKFTIITGLTLFLSFMSIFASIELSKMTVMQKIERDHMAFALQLNTQTHAYFKLLESQKMDEARALLTNKSDQFKQMGVQQLIEHVYDQPAKIYEITIGLERWMFTVMGFGIAFELADKGLADTITFKKVLKQIADNPNNFKAHQASLLKALGDIEENGIRFAPIVTDASNFVSTMMTVMIIIAILLLLSFLYLSNKNILGNIAMFQTGLLNFFDFLSGKSKTSELIVIETHDELNQMATLINQQIKNSEFRIKEDQHFIQSTQEVMGRVGNGWLDQKINTQTSNPNLIQLQQTINHALEQLQERFEIINKTLESYANYNYIASVHLDGIEKNGVFDTLSSDLNKVRDAINAMLVENKSNGLALDESSDTLLKNVQQLNTNASKAAASLQQTSASIEEITQNISSSSESIQKMGKLAQSLSTSATHGQDLATQTNEAMDQIDQEVNAINEAITVIDQIAFQTNILSLNAAVEAATAGEAGKGFAVVAQEVRNLASRSAEAAKEIKTLVENATTKANSGKDIADRMIEGYTHLTEDLTNTVNLIRSVEQSSAEQRSSIEQINSSISLIDQQTQNNASIASETDSIAVQTDRIAKLVVSNANAKEFEGKESVKAKSF
jgi:methyl-accepting chemotaxis protein